MGQALRGGLSCAYTSAIVALTLVGAALAAAALLDSTATCTGGSGGSAGAGGSGGARAWLCHVRGLIDQRTWRQLRPVRLKLLPPPPDLLAELAPGALLELPPPPSPPASIEALLRSHARFQAAALAAAAAARSNDSGAAAVPPPPPPPAVLVATTDSVGLGNRLPAIVTAYLVALLTKRVFLLESSLHDHFDLPLFRWQDYSALYTKNANNANVSGSGCALDYSAFPFADLSGRDAARGLCGGAAPPAPDGGGSGGQADEGADAGVLPLVTYKSIDYDAPFLQANPQLRHLLAALFPSGEVFHALAGHLLATPRPALQQVLDAHAAAGACAVGVQVRRGKYKGEGGVNATQFVQVAKAAAAAALPPGRRQQQPGGEGLEGGVFVTADSGLVLSEVLRALRAEPNARAAWASSVTLEAMGQHSQTAANNPGSELSAIVDVLLLSRCRAIVVTPASSFGVVAAGLAGAAPIYATFGYHDLGRGMPQFLNPWFWKALSSEPCTFKLATLPPGHPAVAAVAATNALFLQHNQCHHTKEPRLPLSPPPPPPPLPRAPRRPPRPPRRRASSPPQ